jgi:hypothetical protein
MGATCWIHNGSARRLSVAVLTGALFCAGISWADRFPPDPVEQLRLALRAFPPDSNLQQRVLALRTVGEMRRALALQDWRPEVAATEEPAMAGRHQAQLLLVERFKKDVRQILKQGGIDTRLAALDMLAEMGPSVTAPDTEDARGIARTFAPELVELIKSGDTPPSIKEAAARSLGQIFPDPDIAVPAFQQLLASPRADERRAAADGLGGLMRTAGQLAAKTGAAGGPPADRGDIIQSVRDVVPVAGRALSDANVEVRRSSAEAMLQAALALTNQIPQPSAGEEVFRGPAEPNTLA